MQLYSIKKTLLYFKFKKIINKLKIPVEKLLKLKYMNEILTAIIAQLVRAFAL